ncbi:MAG: hypothetical protein ACK5EQ_06780 [Bacteroidota bacterium]|jgi:hypothetical protein
MKKMHISVENPCHEDWQKMTPETQGRFCGACEKTVVDFSEMSDAEILLYFSKPKTEKVCGRFRPEQLSPSGESATPRFVESIVSQKMPNYPVQPSKQLLHFAYLLVMVLGVGVSACGDAGINGKVKGQVQMIDVDTSGDAKRGEANDTAKQSPETVRLMGDTVAYVVPNEEAKPPRNEEPKTKPAVHMPMRPKPSFPDEYMTGPYEYPLKPGTANDTSTSNKPIKNVQPVPKYIKGKVSRPIMGKPKIIQIAPDEVQDVKIMGECVMPMDYEKPQG